eukprot:GHUV01024853.1.p1 GENE.GHUV01024853.1~~GHUV01024853.1.p1  ORF type:complete len:149 (+),score=31.60 GHUV01024853.1:800-1246(+)
MLSTSLIFQCAMAAYPCNTMLQGCCLGLISLLRGRPYGNMDVFQTNPPAGVEACLDSQLQLVATDQHSTAAQLTQVLHDLQVVVGLHCITDDVVKTFQSLGVCLDVCCDAVLAVEVEGTLRDLCVWRSHSANVSVSNQMMQVSAAGAV